MNIEDALKQASKDSPVVIISADPGPINSALTLLWTKPGGKLELDDAWYLPNEKWGDAKFFYAWLEEQKLVNGIREDGYFYFVYEAVVTSYNSVIGASVMDTAAMAGELRHAFRPYVDGIYGMPSSAWRHALTRAGNAPAKHVKLGLHEFFEPTGGGSDPYKGNTAQPGPWDPIYQAGKPVNKGGKPNYEHLIDAMGVGVGICRTRFMSNTDPEKFRRF